MILRQRLSLVLIHVECFSKKIPLQHHQSRTRTTDRDDTKNRKKHICSSTTSCNTHQQQKGDTRYANVYFKWNDKKKVKGRIMQFFMLYAIKICFKYVNEKKKIQKYKIKDKQAKHTYL